MAPRGRDLERAPRLLLPVHLEQVAFRVFTVTHERRRCWWLRRNQLSADDMRDDGGESRTWNYLETVDECSLCRVRRRDEDALVAPPLQPSGGNEHAIHVAHGPVEGELAQKRRPGLRRLAHHRQRNRDSHRQIQPAAFLAKLCGGEVHGQPVMRKLQAAVADGGPDALPRFFY